MMDLASQWPFVDHSYAFVGFLGMVGLCTYLCWCSRSQTLKERGGLPLPPGPQPLPVIGNALDIPVKRVWETLSKWAEQYGDIVHVRIFDRHIIYLNSYKAAIDLLEKRGSIYSDRPTLVLVNELLGCDWVLAFMRYGDSWRKHRRMFVSQFGGPAVHKFNPIQEKVANLLLERLLHSPQDYYDHIRLFAGQLIMMCVYGVFAESRSHPYVETAERVTAHLSDAARPGAALFDFIPFLKKMPSWFPGAHYKRLVPEWAKDARTSRSVPFDACKSQLTEGRAPSSPSFVMDILQELDNDDREDETMIQNCAATAHIGGADTSIATLLGFVLAMVLYPEVQKKAQEEIANVVGASRLPKFEDRARLPYIIAIVKEALRWHIIAPQALPHSLIEDDKYQGFFLPKGSIVIGNVWRIAHDPSVYPNPFDFKPERFFNSAGQLDYAGIDPAKFAFGFGRRLCAGQYFAESTLFIAISSILQCFDISHAKDEAGNDISVRLNPSSGTISTPEHFACSITPRSKEAMDLIQQAASDARQDLKE